MPTRDPHHPDALPGAAFPPVDEATWRRRVEAELGDLSADEALVWETREGIDVESLDSAASSPPALAGAARPRGRGWRIAEEYRGPDLASAARAIRAGSRNGVELLWLQVALYADANRSRDRAGRWRPDPIPIQEAADVERLVEGVDLSARAAVLEIRGHGLWPAASWVAGARRLGFGAGVLQGAFGCDPLARPAGLFRESTVLDQRFDFLADLTAWVAEEAPGMRSVLVSTERYHEAGASAVDEVALAAATGVEYLRRLTAAGLGVDAVARRTLFAVGVGCDVFVEIAKLRALRLVWARILAAAGADEAATVVHARGSGRTLARRDPRINLLRGGAQAFAAVAGGADSLAIPPFDEALRPPEERSRRLALMTQHLLKEEAHLGRVADPAAGSWCLEALTDRLARAAWSVFQELESHGGMARCLEEGRVRERVRSSGDARYRAATHRHDALVGVSVFADLGRRPLERRESEPAAPQPELPFPGAEIEAPGAQLELGERGRQAREEAIGALERAMADDAAPLGEVTRRAVDAFDDGASALTVFHLVGGVSHILDDSDDDFMPLRLPEPFERLRDRSERRLERCGSRPRTFLALFGERGAARGPAVRRTLAAAGIESVEGGPFEAGDREAVLAAFAASRSDFAVLCAADDRYPELAATYLAPLQEGGARWVMVAGRGGEHHAALRAAGVDDFLFEGCDLVTLARFLFEELELGAPA